VLNAVRTWILLSTLLVASGWALSALHQLNLAGYGIVFGIAVASYFLKNLWTKEQPKKISRRWFGPFRRRFKQPAPLLFLLLALLALLGGSLYEPSDGGSAAYRIPRVMDWLAAGQWHWIHAFDARLNIAGYGMEWFFAPLILLTHTDRSLFLPNWLSFLLLPGLIFSVFTRLRISPRVAWWWMWLLPSGWCFIMQAGSTINDSFAAAYALAAVDFGLRARESQKTDDVWLSVLSAALATGVKQSDILLAVPGLIAVCPNLKLLLKRPLISSAILGLCLLVSALPNIVFNLKKTGIWSGVTGPPWKGMEPQSPFWGVIGNIFCMTAQNLKPPVFPLSRPWNAAMKHFIQTPFGAHFAGFEDFGRLSFGAGESNVALGVAIIFLALVSIFAARSYRAKLEFVGTTTTLDLRLALLKWTPWVLLLVYMAKVGTFQNGRQFAAYYIFLFPSLLDGPGQSSLVRRGWWKSLTLLVMVISAALLVISRERPLFPSQTILGGLEAKYPHSKFVSTVAGTYSTTPAFEGQRESLRKILPAGEAVLGYASGNDGEAGSSLWLPFGSRRIQYVVPGDTAEELRSAGIHYVVVDMDLLDTTHDSIQQWLARYHATVAGQWEFREDPYAPPRVYYLAQLQS
jgi:hypothetical protein